MPKRCHHGARIAAYPRFTSAGPLRALFRHVGAVSGKPWGRAMVGPRWPPRAERGAVTAQIKACAAVLLCGFAVSRALLVMSWPRKLAGSNERTMK